MTEGHALLAGLPAPETLERETVEGALRLLFDASAPLFGPDLDGYRNHCLRAGELVGVLAPELAPGPVACALFFHDIALWTHRTVDYLDPSAAEARAYLARHGREDWEGPVEAMILWHHKQRAYRGPHAKWAEPVRRADMADFTFGLQGGVPRAAVRAARGRHPNAGFHRMLLRRTIGRLCTKPWSPLPMMRW